MCLQSLMKFHHCLFKIVRKNQNVVDKELQRAVTLIGPYPYFSIMKVHLVDINVHAKFYEFHHCLFKILKNQNIAGGCENSICDCVGYNNGTNQIVQL